MARLSAAFASSHSVMLAAQLEDWLTKFRDSDLRMPYFDDQEGYSNLTFKAFSRAA